MTWKEWNTKLQAWWHKESDDFESDFWMDLLCLMVTLFTAACVLDMVSSVVRMFTCSGN